ncbi:MAG: hydrogenase 3 maturation endopeptidase HyCI [Verrucomicrobiota bacterium]
MPSPRLHPPRRRPLSALLKARLQPAHSLAVVGIGSDLRGDDIAGLLVLRNLRAALARPQRWSPARNATHSVAGGVATAGAARSRPKTIRSEASERVRLFDGGTAPENLTGEIVRFRPSHILLVDAADFGQKPGTVKLIEPENIDGMSFSTHALPLNILADYLKRTLSCHIMILGIQPGRTDFGAPPSREIRQTARRLARIILNAALRREKSA